MITLLEVKRLAKSAKLLFLNNDLNNMQFELDKIVMHVEILNEINVFNIKPMTHVISMNLFLREDNVKLMVGQTCLTFSNDSKIRLIEVPKVFE